MPEPIEMVRAFARLDFGLEGFWPLSTISVREQAQ